MGALVREQVMSVTMGLVMFISSGALVFKAARKIKFWDKWYEDHNAMDTEVGQITEALAWNSGFIFLLLAILRFYGARRLRVRLVWHAFGVSVASALFLLVLAFGASYELEWSWK